MKLDNQLSYEELLHKQMDADSKAITIIGIIVTVLASVPMGFLFINYCLIAVCYFQNENALVDELVEGSTDPRFVVVQITFVLFFVFSIYILRKGIYYKKRKLEKYPEIERLIRDLDRNVIFKNSDFVMNEYAIAPLYHLEAIIPYNEIIKIYMGGPAEGVGFKYRIGLGIFGETFTIKTRRRTVAFLIKNRIEFIGVLLLNCNAEVKKVIEEDLGLIK